MQNENKWYWNLNLHRDQLSLVNSSIENDLPISSNLYTSAVLNDNGICVGMRNVHLKGENVPCFHRTQRLPNCCSNQNVVGERNQQIWETAFDRMKYSTLTDPSMAIHSTHFYGHGIQPNIIIQPREMQCDEKLIDIDDPLHASSIAAETNPFHLFGDSTSLSSFELFDRQRDFHILPSMQMNPMHFHDSHFNLYQPHPIEYSKRNGQKEIPSFASRKCDAPMVATPIQKDTPRTLFHIKISENEKDSDSVAPPKKKWMRNYMLSNCRFYIIQFPN